MAITSSSVGGRIRELRQERKLALAEVAKRAGYTKGFLSKIECGKASPPIATLLRLAAALRVDPARLLQAGASQRRGKLRALRVGAGERTRIENAGAGPGYRFMALAAGRGRKRMEPFLLTVNPGEIDPEHSFEHPGEEFIFVLEGEMDYRVGEEVFPMGPGDSLYFDGALPHAPTPRGGPVRFLAIFSAGERRKRNN